MGLNTKNPSVPLDVQLIKAWIFSQNPDGTFSPASFGGGGGTSNITGINGNPPSLGNPLPVELSDGTNVFGTSGNPVKVAAVASGALKAIITASASGATTIVAFVAAKKIRVLALQLVVSGAVNVKWQSHITPTDITGLASFAANGGYVLPYNPEGWFDTLVGEALDINLSAAVAVGGSLTYVTV